MLTETAAGVGRLIPRTQIFRTWKAVRFLSQVYNIGVYLNNPIPVRDILGSLIEIYHGVKEQSDENPWIISFDNSEPLLKINYEPSGEQWSYAKIFTELISYIPDHLRKRLIVIFVSTSPSLYIDCDGLALGVVTIPQPFCDTGFDQHILNGRPHRSLPELYLDDVTSPHYALKYGRPL